MNNKVCSFDIWGKGGNFKKSDTITTQITNDFPPKPTIYGMLASFIGLDSKEYIDYFSGKSNIGVQILTPIKKQINYYSYILTKENNIINKFENHTKVGIQTLINPKYRIYFNHEDTHLFNRIVEKIKSNESIFNLYLGKKKFKAFFEFVACSEIEKITGASEIKTVLNKNLIEPEDFVFEENDYKTAEYIPREILSGRIIKEFHSYLYVDNLTVLKVKRIKEAYKLKDTGEVITFL